MADETTNNQTDTTPKEAPQNTNEGAPKQSPREDGDRRTRNRRQPRRTRRTSRERVKPEFEQKIISIRRVTRVMGGGRRFSFAVAMVAGDQKGRVGVGTGKAGDTALAIEKALRECKKHMITVPMTETKSIAHPVGAKYSASVVELRPSPDKGLVSGGSVRSVLELAGYTDVSGKILSRSKNRLNNAQATIDALKQLKPTKNK